MKNTLLFAAGYFFMVFFIFCTQNFYSNFLPQKKLSQLTHFSIFVEMCIGIKFSTVWKKHLYD